MKKGFTLAEVLITLGIIGVVAALTLPTLIQKQKEKETVTRLKKVYSVVNQAYALAVNEYGTIENWGLSPTTTDSDEIYDDTTIESSDRFFDILTKYLKVTSRCTYKECGKTSAYGGNAMVKLPDGIIIHGVYLMPDCHYKVGTSKLLQNVCGDIYFNFVEDPKKQVPGENFFSFWITKQGIFPKGTQEDTSQTFYNNCLGNDIKRGCSGWVIFNENMDYFHCDDLSWTGKTKCK